MDRLPDEVWRVEPRQTSRDLWVTDTTGPHIIYRDKQEAFDRAVAVASITPMVRVVHTRTDTEVIQGFE